MSNYRQIHCKIWTDPWFIEREADEKLVFIYLFSNDRANLLGIYDISIKMLAYETGVDKVRVEEILSAFEAQGKIVRDGSWMWIVNLFSYNAQNIASPKIRAHIDRLLRQLGDTILRQKWLERYGMIHKQSSDDGTSDDMDTVSYPTCTDTDTDTDTKTDTDTETETIAPQTAAARPDGRFQAWHDRILAANSRDRSALLLEMFKMLYPERDPPSFGYIGKVAKEVGGAGRLAELLWQHSTRPPTGDVLAYIRKAKMARASPEDYKSDGKAYLHGKYGELVKH